MHDGISREGALLDVGVEYNVINKSGAFLKYGGQMLGQGKEAAKMFLRENTKITKEISEAVWKTVKNGQPAPKHKEQEDDSEE